MKRFTLWIIFMSISIAVFANSMTLQTIKKNISGSSYCVTVSPDQTSVSYVKGDANFMYGQLYIWKVGEKSPIKISGVEDRICEITYSPNSHYILVDSGTSALRDATVVSVSKSQRIAQFEYVGSALFSPNGSVIAYGSVSKIKPKVATEINGVVDISLFDIAKNSSSLLVKANSSQSFEPVSWKGSTLTYKQYDLIKGSSQNLTITVKN